MVFFQGVDLIQIKRISCSYKKYGIKFLKKILSNGEIKLLSKITNNEVLAKKIANKFAAKEALVKAIGTGFRGGISFNQIEVCYNEYGKPSIKISKKLSKIIKEFMPDFSKYNINLTITDEKKYSIAIVTLTK